MKVTRAKSSQTREKGQRRGGKKSKLTHIALACEGCSKAHVKCNGELPCGRCTTRGLHCNYLTRGKALNSCDQCKAKHRKCDGEGLHHCANCESRGLSCTYQGVEGQRKSPPVPEGPVAGEVGVEQMELLCQQHFEREKNRARGLLGENFFETGQDVSPQLLSTLSEFSLTYAQTLAYLTAYLESIWISLGIAIEISPEEFQDMIHVTGTFFFFLLFDLFFHSTLF
eukprot:TRINITY_DN370_c0_g2_i6.p1 TRINITY_DN370_c0_g2~~TRINITY_DN370_c0_g2_i6.p1  ORF type:complete len:239 (+),score=49.49 TRINITY_DN370_c0_g2_i6:42-719(+)